MAAPTRTLADPIVDLTTVPVRNADAVAELLAGRHGDELLKLARDATARAWVGGYLGDASAVLLDVVLHGGAIGPVVSRPGGAVPLAPES